MLIVLRDPSKGTLAEGRAGMLSVGNDLQTAETQFGLIATARLSPSGFALGDAHTIVHRPMPNCSTLHPLSSPT